jgi:hypothetical protein
LRLVPPDTAFCFVVSDLRGHADKLFQSAWFKQFQKSPLWQLIAESPDVKKLDHVLIRELPQNLQVSWPRLRDDILGDAVVFAYRPGGAGSAERGLFLLWARDGQLLAALVKRVNQVQLESGEVKSVRPLSYQGKTYFERVEPKGASLYPLTNPMGMLPMTVPVPVMGHTFYYVDGHLLAFSNERERLLQVLDRLAGPEASKETALMVALLRAGANQALAALWVNPRAFDADLERQAARAHAEEAQGLSTFRRYWQALDSFVVSADVTPDPEVRLSIQGRKEALPAAAQKLLTTASEASDLWRRFPADAIFAVAVRIDSVALKDVVAAFLTPAARKQSSMVIQQTLGAALGMNLTKDVLPQVGPDLGFCIAAPTDKTSIPLVVTALRIRPGNQANPVDGALLKALRFFAGLAIFEYNRQSGDHLRLDTVMQGKVEVTYLAGSSKMPAGFKPALALKGGYLVAASTPDAIARFRSDAAATTQTTQNPLLRLSVSQLAGFLRTQREPIANFLAAQNHTSRQSVAQTLDSVIQTLALFDSLEIAQRPGRGQVLLTMKLQTAAKANR